MLVNGWQLRREPEAGKDNKFVITVDEAWFLPFEDNAQAPWLIKILSVVANADLEDDQVVEALDRRLEEGSIIMGYVSKQTGKVSVHLPDEPASEVVRGRLDEVFGEGTVYD